MLAPTLLNCDLTLFGCGNLPSKKRKPAVMITSRYTRYFSLLKCDFAVCKGKKNLYIRLGCRGDWPNIKPPGWDPSAGDDASPAAP